MNQEINKEKKSDTVFVGLSGGVDSSVAALRLKKQGYDVVGVFIKVWQPEWLSCNWEQERLDAMRVAAKLDIPFLTCDAEAAYRDDVAQYFIAEYKAGRTPNPDVMCNRYVKFGRFLEFAFAHGADYVATGHYAQRVEIKNNNSISYQLHRGVDENKDQTYFLWTLTQENLSKILFPIGDSPKAIVREEAERAGLVTASKKDSQGICFLGQVNIPEFLSHYIDLKPGTVLDESGTIIGEHQGALVYTIGQRHGFTLSNNDTNRKAFYVVARDMSANTITVSERRPKLSISNTLVLEDVSYVEEPVDVGDIISIQTRYRQIPIEALVERSDNQELHLKLQTETEKPAVGQSCVLYKGEQCLGGGIITKCL